MKIESFTGKTEVLLKVYKPVSGIIIKKNGAIADEKIEIKRINGRSGGNEPCTPKQRIHALSEIAAHGPGLFVNQDTEARAFVRVGMANAVSLDDERYLKVELTGLDQAKTYTVYGDEEGVISDSMVEYHPIVIGKDETLKEYGVRDKEMLAIPVAGLERIELIMGGQSISFTPDELKVKSFRENDIVLVKGTTAAPVIVHGFNEYFSIGLIGVDTVKIEKTNAAAMELIFVNEN